MGLGSWQGEGEAFYEGAGGAGAALVTGAAV